MALPTGVFAAAEAGLLTVTWSGDYYTSVFGSAVIVDYQFDVRGYVGPIGGLKYTGTMNVVNATATLTMDYPGANVQWQLGMEQLASNFVNVQGPPGGSGQGEAGCASPRISAQLTKR